MANRIYLGPADAANQSPLLVEGAAVDAIVPGSLVEQTASGLATSNNTATSFESEALVALEQMSGTGATLTTAYTIGDTARAVAVRSGEFVMVRVATGQNITRKGTPMSSNGDGTLKIAVIPATVGATSEQVLFYSDEIVNTSGVTLVRMRKA